MSQVKRLVVGVGNWLAGDDGFGVAVIAALRARARPVDADLLDAGTDLLRHLERFASYDEVILVDAVIDPARRGEVAVVEEGEFGDWPDAAPGCHEISPLTALRLFRLIHPEAQTRFTLVALFTGDIAAVPFAPLP